MSESPLNLTFGARNSAFLQSADDFRKQRVKVTRRIHKLRTYLNIQVKNTRNYKSSQITKENYNGSHKYYLLSLLSAERDYLYALEIRSLIDLNSSTNIKSKQKLLTTRLKRGLQAINNLADISEAEPDFTKRLEILVLRELINAHYSINVKRWKAAIQSYSIARVSLQYLEQAEDSSESNVLYKDIIEETIDEPFKLAIYRDSKKSTIDLTEYSKKIVDETAMSHEIYKLISSKDAEFLKPALESELSKEISWRSYEAQVKDETTAKLLSRASKIELSSIESYDKALSLWQEALENHSSYIARSVQDDEEQDDQILLAFIKYNSLLTRIRRDETLLSKNKKESLRILDTIDSTIQEILELPGVYSDDELFQNLQFLAKYYQSYKLNILGLHFFTIKEYSKTLLLSAKALDLLQSSEFTIDLGNFISNDDVSKLVGQISSLKQNSHVLAQIESTLPKDKSISDDINKFHNSYHNIVNLKLEPIPIKPVLFDVAYNYVSYTKDAVPVQKHVSSSANTDSDSASENIDAQKKKGFFGLFGR
jgi:signal recognition particle subunit SRP68